jgi:hypothetical protein
MRISQELSESAKHNSNHGDIYPRLGTAVGDFIVANQAALFHQSAKSTFHDPTTTQDFESLGLAQSRHHFYHQLGAVSSDPAGKLRTAVAAVHPEQAQPSKPAQHPRQQDLGAGALRRVGWRHRYAQDQSQGIHQKVAFASLGFLGRVIARVAGMIGRADCLTVKNRGGRTAPLACSGAGLSSKTIMEGDPHARDFPLAKPTIDCLPGSEILGQQTPLATRSQGVEDGINNLAVRGGRATALRPRWQHRFEHFPLGIGEIGRIQSFIHPLILVDPLGHPLSNQSNSLLFKTGS